MAKQMHFVICCDLETGEMWQDGDSEVARFPEGVFYNEETDAWSFGDDEDIEPANKAYKKLRELLDKSQSL
jgi:hypothetical protein